MSSASWRSGWWTAPGVLLLVGVVACQRSPARARADVARTEAARGAAPAESPRDPPPTANPAALPGFRADAWFLPDDDLLGFVEVPAGEFLMGSDPVTDDLAFDNELWKAPGSPTAVPSSTTPATSTVPGRQTAAGPRAMAAESGAPGAQGIVDLPTFYIGRYEVTVAQFRAFVEATGYQLDDRALRAPPDHPVTFVSWPDALAYCRWLEATLREWSGTPPELGRLLRNDWRIGLPSEAEWEKAARGTDGRIYPWGDAPRPDRANFRRAATTPVGSFECPECPFGLLDMSGNVWELTRSPYQPYPYDPADDREELQADALWIMRGGHFGDTERNVRAAIRGGIDPGARRPFIGFRIVVSRF